MHFVLDVQLTADAEEAASLDHYMRKTYCKTASLMANSCKAVAVLGGHSPTGVLWRLFGVQQQQLADAVGRLWVCKLELMPSLWC